MAVDRRPLMPTSSTWALRRELMVFSRLHLFTSFGFPTSHTPPILLPQSSSHIPETVCHQVHMWVWLPPHRPFPMGCSELSHPVQTGWFTWTPSTDVSVLIYDSDVSLRGREQTQKFRMLQKRKETDRGQQERGMHLGHIKETSPVPSQTLQRSYGFPQPWLHI